MDHLGKNLLHFVEAGDERIDFAEGVVEGERGGGTPLGWGREDRPDVSVAE